MSTKSRFPIQVHRTERRGSRKHVLDWVEQPRFLEELQALAAPAPCCIPAGATFLPRSHREPAEARLDTFAGLVFPESRVWEELRHWWLAHPKGANTPNWDLAVACEIGGKPGLLLVEAKAHVSELSEAGKAPRREKRAGSADGAQRSKENADKIESAIASARLGLAADLPGIAIRSDKQYQLSNRIAFAWKLASCGVPSVLMYLGFTEDTGMRRPLNDGQHWTALFRNHLQAVCPSGISEVPIRVGTDEFWVLCRAKRVLEASPAPPSHTRETRPASDGRAAAS